MLESHQDQFPRVDDSSFVHPLACVKGQVDIAALCMVLSGAAIIGDHGRIRIGRMTTIEENSVIHAGTLQQWLSGEPASLHIGSQVIIAHGAVFHGLSIGDASLLGINSTVLEGCVIGSHCLIAAGAVVAENSVIPDYSFVAGVPAVIKADLRERPNAWARDSHAGEDYFIRAIRQHRSNTRRQDG